MITKGQSFHVVTREVANIIGRLKFITWSFRLLQIKDNKVGRESYICVKSDFISINGIFVTWTLHESLLTLQSLYSTSVIRKLYCSVNKSANEYKVIWRTLRICMYSHNLLILIISLILIRNRYTVIEYKYIIVIMIVTNYLFFVFQILRCLLFSPYASFLVQLVSLSYLIIPFIMLSIILFIALLIMPWWLLFQQIR